jgi:DNA-binding response OmpR family regulator/chromosome segregation ATPase
MLHILLIESESAMAFHLRDLMERRGHRVEIMPDGLIALAELERRVNLPNLILLRVEIPRMSGYSVCNKMKRRAALRSIPLILISSQGTPETFAQHRRLRTRADGYLSMPLVESELWATLESLIPGISATFDPNVNRDNAAYDDGSLEDPGALTAHSDMLAVQIDTHDSHVSMYQSESSPQLFAQDMLNSHDELRGSVLGSQEHIWDNEPIVLSAEDIEESTNRGRHRLQRTTNDLQLNDQSEYQHEVSAFHVPTQGGQQNIDNMSVDQAALSDAPLSPWQKQQAAEQIQYLWGTSPADNDYEPTIIGGSAPQIEDIKSDDDLLLANKDDDEDTLSGQSRLAALEIPETSITAHNPFASVVNQEAINNNKTVLPTTVSGPPHVSRKIDNRINTPAPNTLNKKDSPHRSASTAYIADQKSATRRINATNNSASDKQAGASGSLSESKSSERRAGTSGSLSESKSSERRAGTSGSLSESKSSDKRAGTSGSLSESKSSERRAGTSGSLSEVREAERRSALAQSAVAVDILDVSSVQIVSEVTHQGEDIEQAVAQMIRDMRSRPVLVDQNELSVYDDQFQQEDDPNAITLALQSNDPQISPFALSDEREIQPLESQFEPYSEAEEDVTFSSWLKQQLPDDVYSDPQPNKGSLQAARSAQSSTPAPASEERPARLEKSGRSSSKLLDHEELSASTVEQDEEQFTPLQRKALLLQIEDYKREAHRQQELLTRERRELTKRIMELESQIQPDSVLQMQLSEAYAQLDAYRDEKRDLYEDMAELTQQLQQRDRELEALRASNQKGTAGVHRLSSVADRDLAEGHTKKQLDEQVRQIGEQKKQLEAQKKQSDEQKKQIDEQVRQIGEQKKQLEAQKKQNDEQKKQIDEQKKQIDEQKQKLEYLPSHLETQAAQLEEQTKLIASHQTLLQEQAATIAKQKEQINQQDQTVLEMQDRFESWEKHYVDFQEEYETLQRLYNTRELDYEKLDEANRKLNKRLEEREADARELRGELAAVRTRLQGHYVGDESDFLLQLAEKEKELQLLREELNDLGEEFDNLQNRHETLLVEQRRVSEELKLRNKALLAVDGERGNLEEKCHQHREEAESLCEQIDVLQHQIELLEKDIDELNRDYDSVSQERNRFRDEVLELNNDIDASREELRNVRDREQGLREQLDALEDQKQQLEQDHLSLQQKLEQRVKQTKDLERELVDLRQKNVCFEQKQFELNEQIQRVQQDHTEQARQLKDEREGRHQQVERCELLEQQIISLQDTIEQQNTKQQFDAKEKLELSAKQEKLQFALEQAYQRIAELENLEQTLHDQLEEQQRKYIRKQEEHQSELLDMQRDWEEEIQQQIAYTRDEREQHWQQVLKEANKSAKEREEYWQQVLKEANKSAKEREEYWQFMLEEEAKKHKQRQQELLQKQENIWEQQRVKLLAEHDEEIARLEQQWQEELNTRDLERRTELEQLQHELQQQHDQMLTSLETENSRLHQQNRKLEQQHRQQLLDKEDYWHNELERRLKDTETQVSLQYQGVIETLEQQEIDLEEQIKQLKQQHQQQQRELERHKRDQQNQISEFEQMRGRFADIEALRSHERNKIQQLEQERDQQIQQHQQRSQDLERMLRETRKQASDLYARFKQQEDQRRTTEKALRDALSLIGSGGLASTNRQDAQSDSEDKMMRELAKLADLDF